MRLQALKGQIAEGIFVEEEKCCNVERAFQEGGIPDTYARLCDASLSVDVLQVHGANIRSALPIDEIEVFRPI